MVKSKITVVGMGYVGMTAALDLTLAGHDVTCIGPIDPQAGQQDTRSTALFPDSVTLLEHLNVWPLVQDAARPLRGIRIVDGTTSLFRAPEIAFRAEECGLDALAMNVPNRVLHSALATRLLELMSPQTHHVTTVDSAQLTDRTLDMTLTDGTRHTSNYTVAADGRHSKIRDAAGIDVRAWHYDQVALACTVTHSASHDDISTEFHRSAGPLTTVPGPDVGTDNTSHLVWIETPTVARSLMDMDDTTFRAQLDGSLHGLLGTISVTGPRGAFPIKGQTARTFARNGVFLAGETAHVIPPIGAQGMNLGLRDVRGIGVAFKHSSSAEVLEQSYNDDRRNDVFLRTTAVDLLNRSLTTPYWPVQALRGAGLHILNMVPPLKRAAMQAGFGN